MAVSGFGEVVAPERAVGEEVEHEALDDGPDRFEKIERERVAAARIEMQHTETRIETSSGRILTDGCLHVTARYSRARPSAAARPSAPFGSTCQSALTFASRSSIGTW